MDAFTEAVLAWWKSRGEEFPAFKMGARIVFAFSPNSAACERVFSLMANMFGKEQARALVDLLQAPLMLRYDRRL